MKDMGPSGSYTEAEAAEALGISVKRLRLLLDQHVFNDGSVRPSDIMLLPSDIILLSYWMNNLPGPRLVTTPRRRKTM